MCDFFTASSDGGHQSRWTDSAKSFSAVLLVIWVSLCHSIPQICHSPSQWLTVSYCIYISLCALACAWKACMWVISRKACKNRSGCITIYAQNKHVSRWISQGSKGLCISNGPHFSTLLGPNVCICLPCPTFKCTSVSRQSATEAYFAGWLYEGAGLSHASEFSAPVNLTHFSGGGFTEQQRAQK